MATTADIRRVGDTLKSQVGDAIDHVSGAATSAIDHAADVASSARETVRAQAGRIAGSAQELYDELDGDSAGAKLRSIVAEYPMASLLVAVAAGFLVGRALRD